MMHVFSDSEEMVIAVDVDDARAVMRELGGPDVWPDDVEIERMPDERPLTILDEEHGEIRKTFGEWAAEKGRGYLCGPSA
jgi:hypothetical protein